MKSVRVGCLRIVKTVSEKKQEVVIESAVEPFVGKLFRLMVEDVLVVGNRNFDFLL